MSLQRIAMGQVSPRLGDVEGNLKKHLDYARRAADEGAHVIVFPELGLTGYQLRDLAFHVARKLDHPQIQSLIDASLQLKIDILFSFVEETDDYRYCVASVYASLGHIVHVHRKVYLPTYGLFEEGRHFSRGRKVDAFTTATYRAGIMICEDAWHPSVPYLLSVAGVEVMFIPAAGPGRALSGDPESGSPLFWDRMLRTYAQLFTSYVVFVNRVGFEDGVFFFGHSFVVSPTGEVVGGTQTHDECLMCVDLDLSVIARERFRSPLLRDEDPHLTQRTLRQLLGGEK